MLDSKCHAQEKFMKNLITLMIVLITVFFIYKKVIVRSNPQAKAVPVNKGSGAPLINSADHGMQSSYPGIISSLTNDALYSHARC